MVILVSFTVACQLPSGRLVVLCLYMRVRSSGLRDCSSERISLLFWSLAFLR